MAHTHSQSLSQTVNDDDQPQHVPLIPLNSKAFVSVLEALDVSTDYSRTSADEKNDPPRVRSNAISRLRSSLHTSWGFELLASTFSLLAFVALILVLKQYDRRPQAEWAYNRLTLNGLVAVLSTICRAALLIPVATALSQGKWIWYSRAITGKPLQDLKLFDDASRGALGSFQLLWRTKGRHLVSFGAVLTILALAFDTFSQQVLSVEFRNIVDTSPSAEAHVPRSEVYNHSVNLPNSTIAIADFPMQASILNGALTRDTSELPVYCSTGNCTWSIIPSLSMCGDCTDVSKNLTHSCNSTHCTYSLPSGNSITGPAFQSSATADGVVFSIMAANGRNGTVYSANHLGSPLYTFHFEGIGVPWEAPLALNPNVSHVTGTECALWFCVQAYHVYVEHGRQSQETLGTWSKTGRDRTFVDLPSDFNVASGVSFSVGPEAYQGLVLAFLDLVQQGMTSVSIVGGRISWSHQEVLPVWQGTQDWNKFIKNLALSMSNTIRLTAPADNSSTDGQPHYYAGQAFATASFVRVRWQWLVFPALMVIASIVFLILSMWQTVRSRVSDWKANPLPLLCAHMDEELVRKAEGAMCLGDFKTAIGSERALLEKDLVGRWHFRSATGQSTRENKAWMSS